MIAALLHSGIPSIVWTLLIAGLIIWLVFFVLPLPQIARTILAVIVAVALILLLLGGCTNGRCVGGFTGSIHLVSSFATQKK